MHTIVTRRFLRIVAVVLLAVIVVAGAGATCLLPVAAAHSPVAGCHSARVPSHPRPVDYRCCIGKHRAALLTSVCPRPAVQPFEDDATDVPVVAGDHGVIPSAIAPSGDPPGRFILRI